MAQIAVFNIIIILISFVPTSISYKFYESLAKTVQKNPDPIPNEHLPVVNEYYYGNCKDSEKVLYALLRVRDTALQDKMVARGWLEIPRSPICIIIRAKSANPEDAYRASTYSFNICVPRITYCHSQELFEYFYFEWFIPPDYVIGGIHHDLLFYGPSGVDFVVHYENISSFDDL